MMHDDVTQIKITNIVAKSQLVPPFSLSSLYDAYFYPSGRTVLSRILLPFKHMSLSIFRTGTVISRSAHSFSDLKASFDWLQSRLSPFDLKLSDHYTIINIVAFANLVPPMKLSILATQLLNCTYDPYPLHSEKDNYEHLVNCITFRFYEGEAKPRCTALIFPSGKVTFTGFKSVAELDAHALKLSSIIAEISQNHPEVLKK